MASSTDHFEEDLRHLGKMLAAEKKTIGILEGLADRWEFNQTLVGLAVEEITSCRDNIDYYEQRIINTIEGT